jgi:hypothetical protein
LRISPHARAFYSLIKELFNSETIGICLVKLQTLTAFC